MIAANGEVGVMEKEESEFLDHVDNLVHLLEEPVEGEPTKAMTPVEAFDMECHIRAGHVPKDMRCPTC
eukprot:1718454-Amphidinium_carterae.1